MNTNLLVDPPFAADPPVKLNIDAKILGLVLAILAGLGALTELLLFFGLLGVCNGLNTIYISCSVPILGIVGYLVIVAGYVVGAIGAYRMYTLNPQGKEWAIYGIVLAAIGNILTGIGYSGYGIGGLIVGLIVDFIIYYLIVISRFPGQAPLVASGPTSWGGPPQGPPPQSPPPQSPPPPPSA